MITWLWPWLALLLPLPLLMRRFWPAAHSEEPALRVPFFQRWQALGQQQSRRGNDGNRATLLLLWLLWICLLLAAARPIWIGDPVELPKSGRDLMLAVDLSGSMRVEDMQVGNNLVRRIDAVRTVGADFISRRQGDRVGLILFGSNAYVQSPLTFDVATVEQFLLDARIGFAGQETAIGDAIGLAVKRLRERPAESRVLVLLTDGQDTASTIGTMDAARLAQGLGIRIYTIGIGADQLALPGLFGSSFGSRRGQSVQRHGRSRAAGNRQHHRRALLPRPGPPGTGRYLPVAGRTRAHRAGRRPPTGRVRRWATGRCCWHCC